MPCHGTEPEFAPSVIYFNNIPVFLPILKTLRVGTDTDISVRVRLYSFFVTNSPALTSRNAFPNFCSRRARRRRTCPACASLWWARPPRRRSSGLASIAPPSRLPRFGLSSSPRRPPSSASARPTSTRYAHAPMPDSQCQTPNTLCQMPSAQCPLPNAQCPMPNVQCPVPNAQRPTTRCACSLPGA